MSNISETFGSMVFNDHVMRERLPRNTYKAFIAAIEEKQPLDLTVANVVANAMKDWAVEHGATHFTHWFQPMTGITAEKHDSFVTPVGDGTAIMEFSGKELIKGESDASSFPSGGLRATFEARGYTAWDPTSYAFIKDGTLCIPTAFCSYSGQALDKKTPLLRSMEEVSRQAVRILRLFGNTEVKQVITTVGPEQEYFLIDREDYKKRKDLIYTGRTLFGAKPPKGQELEDHYYGTIRPRVSAFMKELDSELWKLGVSSHTKHNEVAPAQHELAPLYASANVAADHNQLTMELMKRIAQKHGFACLLHEKPFAGVNGSGKHDNWSLATDTGVNLLEPGDSPMENAQFLLFLCAVIKAVDEHQDLLRLTVATAGNEHRLGANEAPPAIVSMFVGEELEGVLNALADGSNYAGAKHEMMEIGVDVLPRIPRDTTDRNRTSPFAFTGNKFEFRMLGAPLSVSGPTFVLNTIVAEALDQFANELELAHNFRHALEALIKRTIREHRRIIFNGNGYDASWIEEAERRGLLNLASAPEALPYFIREENIALFEKYHVLTGVEVHSRYEILMENYIKTLNIEALTMLEMARREILPAVLRFSSKVARSAQSKKALCEDIPVDLEISLVRRVSALAASMDQAVGELDAVLLRHDARADSLTRAKFFRYEVFPAMQALRAVADELETIVGKEDWPFPTYGDLLYYV